MKTIAVIIALLFGTISVAQHNKDFEILELYNESPLGLVSLLDSANINALVKTPHLDSAASHHAQYLLIDFLEKYPLIKISHEETVDYPDFEEKLHPHDRTGFANQTQEICNIYNTKKIIFKRKSEMDFLIKTGHVGSYKSIFFPNYAENLIFECYKKSSAHWEIIQDPNLVFVGSSNIVCVYRSTKDLSQQQISDGKVEIGLVSINVSVFTQNSLLSQK